MAGSGGEKIKGNGNVIKQERTPGSFRAITIAGSMDLYLRQGDREAVIVKTDENLQEVIITEIRDGKLSIHVKDDVEIRATDLEIHVECKHIESITSAGSGDIETTSTLRSGKLSVSHGGSGDFDLELDVGKFSLSAAGSGDFELSGQVESMELSLAGSGDVEADDLECGHAKVSIAGSCDVKLKKGTAAKVNVAGSGDVKYD